MGVTKRDTRRLDYSSYEESRMRVSGFRVAARALSSRVCGTTSYIPKLFLRLIGRSGLSSYLGYLGGCTVWRQAIIARRTTCVVSVLCLSLLPLQGHRSSS